MPLQSSQDPEVKFETSICSFGQLANIRFVAYKVKDGVKTYYPELDRQVQTPNSSTDRPSLQLAAGKIMAAMQEFINTENF